MAKSRATLKCSKCKEVFPREDITKVSNLNYCPTCLEEKNKPKELTDWDYLYQYLCELHNVDRLDGLTFKRLKEYRDEYGYTDIGMYLTLKYIRETLNKEVYDNGHLAQIPYYYNQAKQHVLKTYEIADIVDNFDFQEKVVSVNVSSGVRKWTPKKPLDLGKIDWSEEYED